MEEDYLGPGTLDAEIKRALRDMKARRAVGVDNIPCELLKNLGRDVKERFYGLVRRINEEGCWPKNFVNFNSAAKKEESCEMWRL